MADPDPYAEFYDEPDPYAEFYETPAGQRPQQTAPRAKDRVLVPRTGIGSALEAIGLLQPAIERAGAPVVGGAETYANKAVNMTPLGGLATDLGVAASFLGAQKAGKVAPGAARALSGLTGKALPEWLQLSPVPGPGAVLTPEAEKELAALGVDTKEPEAGVVDTYRRLRDVRRTRTEAGEEQHPLTALAGSGTGLGLSLLGPAPRFTPAGGGAAGAGARIAAGAKTGAAYGGLAGLTSGDADTAGGDFVGTAMQGIFGAGLGSLLGAAAPAAGAFGSRVIRGVVQPTPAAQALQQEGVKGLTLGQQAMSPSSKLGSFEGASQSNAIIGPVIRGQRGEAVDSLRRVALSKGVAPGATPPPEGATPPEAIGHLRKGFNAAYDAIRDVKVPTRAVDRLLVAVDDPDIIADPATRLAVSKFLQNQMGRLPAEGTETTAGVLMKVREKVREEAFKALRANNMDRHALLERAEQELTEGLNAGLPEDASKALRATDAAYRNFKILQDAVSSAGDTASGPGMFTPKGLSSAVERATGETSYAELGGGPLRRLASAAAQTFAEPEHTGWGASLAGGMLGYGTTPFMALANRPGMQPFMLGQTAGQQRAQQVQAALQRYLARLKLPPQSLVPQAGFEATRTTPEETP